jgi:glutamate synthase (NADPH/NADH) small chain
MVIGKVLTITELMKEHGFESVFIASGAGLPQFMHIPGEGHVASIPPTNTSPVSTS